MNSEKKGIVVIKAGKKKSSIISMLDKAIDYGEDLKSQINSDNENRLDSFNSEYQVWASDNKKRLEEVICNYESHYPPFFGNSNSISRAEILGDSEDEIAYIEYERKKKKLISDVENELSLFSTICESILNGNYRKKK